MQKVTCIICPKGCEIEVEGETTRGHGCKRGIAYALAETTNPVRTLTTTVRISGTDALLPVRSAAPIPKPALFTAMEVLRNASVKPPVAVGDCVVANVADTGVDIVAAKSVKM